MYCNMCGAPLADDAKFCEHCGAKVETVEADASSQQPQSPPPAGSEPASGATVAGIKFPIKLSRNLWFILGGAVVLIAALVILIVVLSSRSGKIDLNNYITITCSGYDSVGYASYEFDENAFLNDYGSKISFSKKAQNELGSWLTFLDMNAAELLVEDCVGGTLDQTSSLSNGDVITFTWSCDDETAEEYFGVKLKYSDITYTVSELEEVGTFDPFAEIEIVYSGISPNGSAYVQNNSVSAPASDLSFELSPSSGLSNGMTVTVSISNIDMTYLAETYGLVPSATEKEYTVEGLSGYVTQLSEIPEETMGKLKSQVEDAIAAQAARDWDDGITLNSTTYLGSYLLVPKNSESSRYSTQLYMVYKIQVHENPEDTGVDDVFEYYYYAYFTDLILLADGTCSVDLSDYTTCGNRFSRELTWSDDSRDYTKTLYYYGYENLDSLFNNCVTAQIDEYTYETTVENVAVETEPAETQTNSQNEDADTEQTETE